MFEEARTLMTSGRYEEACVKFAESQRIDRASGTLLNLALCHEKLGKTATAWSEYNDVVASARLEGNAERQRIAAERTREIEPRLCHLSVVSSPDLARSTFTLRIDGVTLGAAAWGMPIPVDPGNHQVEVIVSGRTAWSGSVPLQGDRASWVLTVIAPDEESKQQAFDDGTVALSSARRRRLSYVLAGSAALALGVGTLLGLRAKSEWNERNQHCPANVCDSQAVSAAKSARTFALAADGAFGVGLIGIAFATYFAVTAAPKVTIVIPSVGVSVASDHIRLEYGGHF